MNESSSHDQGYEIGYQLGQSLGGVIGCLIVLFVPAMFILSLILAIVKRSVGWAISTFLFGFLGLALIGLVVYIGMSQEDGGSRDSSPGGASFFEGSKEETKTFVTSDGLARIEGPDYWSELKTRDSEATLTVGSMRRSEVVEVISESKVDVTTRFGLGDYADSVRKLYREEGDLQFPPLTLTTVDGLPVMAGEGAGSIGGVRYACFLAVFEGRNHFHQVLARTSPSKKEKAMPVLKRAAKSFREGSR